MLYTKNVDEVNVELNRQIANLLSKGYIFSSILGSGHQGEEAKYILTNAEERRLAVVYTKNFTEFKGMDSYEGIKLVCGHIDNFVENSGWGKTIWLDQIAVDEEKVFKKVGDFNEIYTADDDFYVNSKKLHWKRYDIGHKAKVAKALKHIPESVEKSVRATYGFKNTKGIRVSVCNTSYTVTALNNKGEWKFIQSYAKKLEKHIHPKANEISK